MFPAENERELHESNGTTTPDTDRTQDNGQRRPRPHNGRLPQRDRRSSLQNL